MVVVGVGSFFVVLLLASVVLSSPQLRGTWLGRWWRSRGTRLALSWLGLASGTLLALYGLPRLDWPDILIGLVVALVSGRDIVTLRRGR